MKNPFKYTAAAIAILCSSLAFGATSTLRNAEVLEILTADDTVYGGCMVRLSVSPQAHIQSCGPFWVALSCSGDHSSISSANRKLEIAKMAYALGKQIQVVIDSNRTHNGFCFASDVRTL